MINFLRELIAARSPSGGEADAAALCEQEMQRLGFDVQVDRLGNVIGVIGGSGPLLLFDAHCDTVAPGDGWTRDPYDPAVIEGRVYGRGSTDMKGAIAALIHGVAGARPPNRIGVSITTLEETAEGATLGPLCDTLEPNAVIIAEPSDCLLALAQKGRAELMVRVSGRVAHAAYPHRGRSALLDAARLLLAAEEFPVASEPDLGDALLVATEATTFPRPGISIVPDRCEIRFDRRLLPHDDPQTLVADIERLFVIAGVDASIEVISDPVVTYTGVSLPATRWLPAWRTSADSALARSSATAIGSVEHTVYRFCTNGSATTMRGIPTVGYGPGSAEGAHQPDEWIAVDQVELAMAGYRSLAEMDDWKER